MSKSQQSVSFYGFVEYVNIRRKIRECEGTISNICFLSFRIVLTQFPHYGSHKVYVRTHTHARVRVRIPNTETNRKQICS